MLGRERAGPASNKAKAGPLPIPEAIKPCKTGISVSVAKYIKAPTTEAKKFENKELPPTSQTIQSLGIMPGIDLPS